MASQYRHITPEMQDDRACTRATLLAGLIFAGLMGLVLIGLSSVFGAIGLGIWRLAV